MHRSCHAWILRTSTTEIMFSFSYGSEKKLQLVSYHRYCVDIYRREVKRPYHLLIKRVHQIKCAAHSIALWRVRSVLLTMSVVEDLATKFLYWLVRCWNQSKTKSVISTHMCRMWRMLTYITPSFLSRHYLMLFVTLLHSFIHSLSFKLIDVWLVFVAFPL